MFFGKKNSASDTPDGDEAPFQVVVKKQTPADANHPEDAGEEQNFLLTSEEMEDEELSLEEIEAAYLKALDAADEADLLTPDWLENLPQQASPEDEDFLPQMLSAEQQQTGEEQKSPEFTQSPSFKEEPEKKKTHASSEIVITSRQVVEAVLFVGGPALPTKKIIDLLGGNHSHDVVTQLIDELNATYSEEGRPYHISLIEGGYRMQLLEAFEPVRAKVYGHGPKEVKLTQEALEVLAFIAYCQPVTDAQLAETERENIRQTVRQLLHRGLVSLERLDNSENAYKTTHRFLELFGLRSLHDLPQAQDFNFK